jgi:hypothetical protein
MEDPDHGPLDDQRDAEQRPDVLLPHQGIDDGYRRVVEVWNQHRLARRGHPPREATPDRQSEPPFDLLLQALRGAGRQRSPVVLDQEHRGGVGVEDVRDALEQLGEQVVEIQVGERRIRDLLDVLETCERLLLAGRGLDALLICRLWRRYSVEMLGSA